jgi:hypothetical protein
MGLNDRITEEFQVETNKSKQEILQRISDGKQNQNWTDYLVPTYVNYKSINILDKGFETVRMPSMINPFRPYGKIMIDIEENKDKTNLKFKILPYDGLLPIVVGLLIGFLTLWTGLILLFSTDLKVLLMIIPAWTIFGLIIYLGLVYTKRGLKDYSQILIRELTQDK